VFKEFLNGGVDSFVVQGRRHYVKSGVQILLRAKREKGGCTSTYDILWVHQLQRDIRRTYRTASPRNMLVTIFLTVMHL